MRISGNRSYIGIRHITGINILRASEMRIYSYSRYSGYIGYGMSEIRLYCSRSGYIEYESRFKYVKKYEYINN